MREEKTYPSFHIIQKEPADQLFILARVFNITTPFFKK